MRGLFEKDFRLLCQNRQTLILFLMMAGFLGLTQNGTFVLGYLSFMFSILLTSTISYDEMDQGFEFLMTLPVTPKTYVQEKYGFCTVGVIFSVVFCGIIYLIVKRNSWRADPAWGRASDGSVICCTDCLVCDCDYGADTVEIRRARKREELQSSWFMVAAHFCFILF